MIQYHTIAQVRAQSPFPWRQELFGKGQVRLIDAGGNEVPLFALTNLCLITTALLVKVPEVPKEAV